MAVGNIGIGAFDPPRKIGPHEQIKDAVNRIGCHALAPINANAFGDVIGRGRLLPRGKGGKHIGTHIRPLFASLDKRIARGMDQLFAGEIVMVMVSGHGL